MSNTMMLMYQSKIIHASYFVENKDGFHIKMNLYFNESYAIIYMRLYCYIGDEIQYELPQDVLVYLVNYHCLDYRTE